MSRPSDAACMCPSRPCPVHAPGMTDLMVSPEAIDAALASPEWAVREYEDLREDYLTLRGAIIEARRELWWFIENDEPNGEMAARAIRIQDDVLGKALAESDRG